MIEVARQIEVTRKYRFSASHRLHSDAFSPEENVVLFGKCNNPYGHGHDYELFVTAQGPLDARTGQVCSPALLDSLVDRRVVKDYEHRYMNIDLPEFAATVPTTENVATAIADRLRQHWAEAFPSGEPRLSRVRIRETDRNIFELVL